MTPAQHTRIVLTEYKQLGVPFPTAWASAMRSIPRKTPDLEDWRRDLEWAKPAFHAAYTGRPLEVVHEGEERSRLMVGGPTDAQPAEEVFRPELADALSRDLSAVGQAA